MMMEIESLRLHFIIFIPLISTPIHLLQVRIKNYTLVHMRDNWEYIETSLRYLKII